jgi:type II secretory pathway component PulM
MAMSINEEIMTIEQTQEELATLRATLAKINKIANDARNGVNAADWRKDWQRNEWTKVRDLSNV